MSYLEAAKGWQSFYATAGSAAATLVGLLFVGLTLHIRTVVSHPDVRSLARVTLTDFFVVLVVSLLILAPTEDAAGTGRLLIVTALVSLGLIARPVASGVRNSQTIGLRVLVARFGFSVLCFLGLATAGVLLATGDPQRGLGVLVIPVLFLLVVAVRNTWDLLVVVADRQDTES